MAKSEKYQYKFILYSAENISAMLFGLVSVALIARVFGPENVGRLSTVQAISAIFMFLATFGLDHFVLRDLTTNKNDGELKGSLIFAQSIGWMLYVAGIAAYFTLQGSLRSELFLIASVAISTYFLRVLFFKLYLQAINDAKSIAISAIVSRVVAMFFLLMGALYQFSYDLMVLYLPLQACTQALMMLKAYKKDQQANLTEMAVSLSRVKSMLMEARPVMLSGAIYFGFTQADILLISHFLGVRDVGIYSAAMRLIPQAAFLGHITVVTFYGVISQHYHESKENFLQYTTKIMRIQLAIGLFMAFNVSLLAPLIIWLLYGRAFEDSAAILAIGVWGWVFIFPSALISRLLVLNRLARYDLIKTLIAAPLSLGLNVFLIPIYGAIAAVCVSVSILMLTEFLVYGFFKDTRFIFRIGVDAFMGLFKHPVVFLRDTALLFKSKS